ncbi:MAG: sigma-70 family RNA polymerase sigma factor [bacterium]|nr:sigma-70 family RNA polymerase sigma factor [bacterium]
MTQKVWYTKISEFFRKEQGKLVWYVRNRIDDSADRDAEDIVQDVMMNLFNKANVLLPVEDLSSYIYQALRNKIIDLFRRRRNEVSLDTPFSAGRNITLKDILHDARYDVATEMEKKEMQERLYAAIETLNEDEEAVVIATEFDDRSFRDLSEEWDTPIGTLLARKSRALAKLKKRLKHR